MSVDVLAVNRQRVCNVQLANNVATVQAAAAQLAIDIANPYTDWSQSNNWSSFIPAAPVSGTALCVFDGTYLRCGVCCLWTVPAGVTRARFEIWGAGGGTVPGCCCAITPFGATGAYATVCLPVTAGHTYTLCAGCAYCCYPQQATTGCHGCASYITGCGLCNFCAMGGARGDLRCANLESPGIGHSCCFLAIKFQRLATSGVNRNIPSTYCAHTLTGMQCGACLCSFGDICISTTTQTSDGIIPIRANTCRTFHGTACNFTAGCTVDIFGVPSLFSEVCYTGGNCCGWIKHPPIPQFESVSQCCEIICATRGTFGSFACSTFSNTSFRAHPGAGGHGGALYAGCNTNTHACGDSGRGGMVRVIFC